MKSYDRSYQPTRDEVIAERKRLKRNNQFKHVLMSTSAILCVVAAVTVLIATLFLPVIQVTGTSMEPTLSEGDIIFLLKTNNFKTGDLIGFNYEGKVLLKRVIGNPGDYILIDTEGNVYVNDELIDEPYVTGKSLGECDLTFPYQVPENSWFVLGDHRDVSIDSRSSAIGCVRKEQIIGKMIFKI